MLLAGLLWFGLGFVWSASTGLGSIAGDAAQLHAATYVDFAAPNATQLDTALSYIRIARYTASCPTDVYTCTVSQTDLATFAAANPGQSYELGNEPGNQDGGGTGFVAWEVATYNAIKASDPTSIIDGPGVVTWNTDGWTTLAAGSEYYHGVFGTMRYDRIAMHEYPNDLCMTKGLWAGYVRADISAVARFAGTTPVDITEVSESWQECGSGVAASTVQNDVRRMLAEAEDRGVTRVIWYTSRQPDPAYGSVDWLINTDNSLTVEGQVFKGPR